MKSLFVADPILTDVWISGEVSNLSRSASGHTYWTLKDPSGQIKCVMFKREAAWQYVRLDQGMSILAHGRIDVYEAAGAYQFYVDLLELHGVGLLYLQLEQLKRRLEAEGLFDQARKRPLPERPLTIGMVTSPTGAVLQDMLQVLARRCPRVRVVLAPATVQGQDAAPSVCSAIELLNRCHEVDVIIVARGGGSIEDLWGFNEEMTARAVVSSRVPVISGVGHETDITICDLVADVRAATPSVAAELVATSMDEDRRQVRNYMDSLHAAMVRGMEDRRDTLDRVTATHARNSPRYTLAGRRQRIDDLLSELVFRTRSEIGLARRLVDHHLKQLSLVDHRAVLHRGYAIVRNRSTGGLVNSVSAVSAGELVDIEVRDGKFGARVS